MCWSSPCFRGHNLHPRVTVLCTLSAISFFPSFFYRLKRITWALLLCNKNIGHHARLREKELLFRCQALLVRNFLRFARAHAHLRARMTQKSCAVGMRNAILRNHLKEILRFFEISRSKSISLQWRSIKYPASSWFLLRPSLFEIKSSGRQGKQKTKHHPSPNPF